MDEYINALIAELFGTPQKTAVALLENKMAGDQSPYLNNLIWAAAHWITAQAAEIERLKDEAEKGIRALAEPAPCPFCAGTGIATTFLPMVGLAKVPCPCNQKMPIRALAKEG